MVIWVHLFLNHQLGASCPVIQPRSISASSTSIKPEDAIEHIRTSPKQNMGNPRNYNTFREHPSEAPNRLATIHRSPQCSEVQLRSLVPWASPDRSPHRVRSALEIQVNLACLPRHVIMFCLLVISLVRTNLNLSLVLKPSKTH